MSATRDSELESFKTAIDLRVYASEAEGYALDRKESWRGSSVLRHPNGDKIIVKKDHDGHYVYFSVRDETDNGSIIDFVQKRRGGTLGQVRQILRPWVGGQKTAAVSLPLFPALQATTKDRMEVERQYRMMDDACRHAYLEAERRLPASLLAAPRFAGRIKSDRRGNAVFPHFDQNGLCGYEIKNSGYTGFARGGEKGLWFSRTESADDCLVICESAIDALSYAALFPAVATRYASIGGQMNKRQPALVAAVLAKLPSKAQIIAATDNDADGLVYAESIGLALSETGRCDLHLTVHRPQAEKDWNLVLQIRDIPLPTARIG